MITVVMTVDTRAQFSNGKEGIALSLSFTHSDDDRSQMVELASGVIDKFTEAMKQGAAQSKEGLHYVETIYPKKMDDASTSELPDDLRAALEVAKQQFTGIAELVQHSPRDIAEVHLATVLRDYLSKKMKPLVDALNTATTAAEELSEANEWAGSLVEEALNLLRGFHFGPSELAQAIVILEDVIIPAEEQQGWMDPADPPPAEPGLDSQDVYVEIVDEAFAHVGFCMTHYDHKGDKWAGWRYKEWEPTFQIFRWRYLTVPQKETDE